LGDERYTGIGAECFAGYETAANCLPADFGHFNKGGLLLFGADVGVVGMPAVEDVELFDVEVVEGDVGNRLASKEFKGVIRVRLHR